MITRHRTGAQLFLALQSLALWSVLAPGQGLAQVGEGAGPERGVAVISPDTVIRPEYGRPSIHWGPGSQAASNYPTYAFRW